MGIVAVLFLVLKILIKAVGDELRHPPFIRSSNRVLILGRNLTDKATGGVWRKGFPSASLPMKLN